MSAARTAPASVTTLLTCVIVASPLSQLITPPSARNRSENCLDVEPRAAPSFVVGSTDEAVSVVVFIVLTVVVPVRVGAAIVGDVLNTITPVPVSSVIHAPKLAEVGVLKSVFQPAWGET